MSDWKNNPAITAIIAGSVVLTTTLLVIFNYALPVYQQADKNTIAELKLGLEAQNKKNLNYIEHTNKLTKENTLLKNEVNGYKDYLLKLSLSSAFQHKNPLPIGYAKILPGMKLSDVYDSYEKVRITPGESGGYLKIKPNVASLGSIIYYAGDDEKPNLITHIFINKLDIFLPLNDAEKQLKSSIDRLSLLDFLNENLGPSETCGKEGNIWHFSNEPYYVYFSKNIPDEYSIWLNKNYKPGIERDCILKI